MSVVTSAKPSEPREGAPAPQRQGGQKRECRARATIRATVCPSPKPPANARGDTHPHQAQKLLSAGSRFRAERSPGRHGRASGIGKASGDSIRDAGMHVVIAGRRGGRSSDATADGARRVGVRTDVSDRASVQALAGTRCVSGSAPRIVLCNNAGVGGGGLIVRPDPRGLAVGARREPLGRDATACTRSCRCCWQNPRRRSRREHRTRSQWPRLRARASGPTTRASSAVVAISETLAQGASSRQCRLRLGCRCSAPATCGRTSSSQRNRPESLRNARSCGWRRSRGTQRLKQCSTSRWTPPRSRWMCARRRGRRPLLGASRIPSSSRPISERADDIVAGTEPSARADSANDAESTTGTSPDRVLPHSKLRKLRSPSCSPLPSCSPSPPAAVTTAAASDRLATSGQPPAPTRPAAESPGAPDAGLDGGSAVPRPRVPDLSGAGWRGVLRARRRASMSALGASESFRSEHRSGSAGSRAYGRRKSALEAYLARRAPATRSKADARRPYRPLCGVHPARSRVRSRWTATSPGLPRAGSRAARQISAKPAAAATPRAPARTSARVEAYLTQVCGISTTDTTHLVGSLSRHGGPLTAAASSSLARCPCVQTPPHQGVCARCAAGLRAPAGSCPPWCPPALDSLKPGRRVRGGARQIVAGLRCRNARQGSAQLAAAMAAPGIAPGVDARDLGAHRGGPVARGGASTRPRLAWRGPGRGESYRAAVPGCRLLRREGAGRRRPAAASLPERQVGPPLRSRRRRLSTPATSCSSMTS